MGDTERLDWLEKQQGFGLISDDNKHWAVSTSGFHMAKGFYEKKAE